MRVNIDHSEGGTCNSQFSKSIQGVDLNTGGIHRVGLQTCVVTRSDLMRVSWTAKLKIIKFKNIFDLHRSPVVENGRAPQCLHTRPTDPVNGKTWVNVHSCQIWGKYRRVNIDHSEGGTCNSQFSKSIQGVDLNTSGGIRIGQGYKPVQLQGLTLCGSVTAGRQS